LILTRITHCPLATRSLFVVHHAYPFLSRIRNILLLDTITHLLLPLPFILPGGIGLGLQTLSAGLGNMARAIVLDDALLQLARGRAGEETGKVVKCAGGSRFVAVLGFAGADVAAGAVVFVD
jgi:hypothetical protein